MNRAPEIPQPAPIASGYVGLGFMRGLACALLLAVGVVLALAGCATLAEKPPELLSSVQTVTVKIPVPIACVAANEKPPIPPTNMRPGTDAEQMHAQMRADLDEWKVYGIQADALLTSCINAATPPKGQP